MTAHVRTATLGMVMAELGTEARLVVGSEDDLSWPVVGATVLTSAEVPPDLDIAVIAPDITSKSEVKSLADRVSGRRLVVLTSAAAVPVDELAVLLRGHVVVEVTADPARVVLAIARVTDTAEESVTRRLASLQRSLTQVLGEPEPVVALLARLKSTCNATVAVVDKDGQAVQATGPVPLSLLFSEMSQTAAETQMLDADGWYGVADRIHDHGRTDSHVGWLVVIARRENFPDSYTLSAVHVAVALVEASQRMTLVARQQERAIRAAVLEEALALQRVPEDPELAGRIASLGLSFANELRTLVAMPLRTSPAARGRPAMRDVVDTLGRAFEGAGIPSLVSVRDKYVVMVAQASPAALRRILVASDNALRGVNVGIGRRIRLVADVAASYHDAQLAIQTLKRAGRSARVVAYEDFDFATRLFSDIGVDRMTEWARDFLRPLEQREPLLEGVRAFFAHSQNMNAAADALNIHHNSLRYRLAKAEELLDVNLRDPAAVSSLFLALAARDLERVQAAARPRITASAGPTLPADIEAPRTPGDFVMPSVGNLGVVIGPER